MSCRKTDQGRRSRGLSLIALVLAIGMLAPAAPAAAQTAGSYSERVLNRSELLSYWRLGETSGTVATDVKSARNGTYVGGVTLGPAGALSADPDKAARFDGVDDIRHAADAVARTTSFTIEGWQMITDGAGANNTAVRQVQRPRMMPRPARLLRRRGRRRALPHAGRDGDERRRLGALGARALRRRR